jgi:folate-binding protein YgfZ
VKELIVDQSDWDVVALTGEDRVRFLQGMCSANIETLAEGTWARAVVLNPKGRVTAVLEVGKEPERLLLVCEPGQGSRVTGILERYAVMDDVEFEPVDVPVHRVWGAPATVWQAPPILSPAQGAASADEVEARRVEAGLPRFGVDVSEDYFPFESGLAEVLDYEKGCYIGQEPIYRVHAKGKPNKHMLGLVIEGDQPVSAGAQVSHPEREAAGTVTSSVVSPDYGVIAMAYIHRSVAEAGQNVTVEGRPAILRSLPFDSTAEGA